MTIDLRAWLRRMAAALCAAAMLLAPLTPARAAAFYVDNSLGELAAVDKAVVPAPRPVQLLFQFTTAGVANARAVKFLKKQVFDLVRASGAFSEVSETPVAGGAMLVITIDNTADKKDAVKKGFAAGLTFGLAGAVVVDNYAIKAEYSASAGAPTIKAEVSHRLFTRVGKKDDPPGATRVKNAQIAIATIVRQGVSHAVNRVALDPGFGGQRAAAVAPAPESAAPPAPAATPQ